MYWLVGAHGLLGGYVRKLLAERGLPVLATDREIDIADQVRLLEFARPHPIDVIVNCAGFSNVRACETEEKAAFRANAEGVRHLAYVAAEKSAHMLHVSTDYVFDGTAESPYTEDAPANPLNAYGKTKLAGEEFLRAAPCRWTVVRTSWLFGKEGSDFVSTVLSRLSTTGAMKIVHDQSGKPTYAADLAAAMVALVDAEPGIYHVANEGTTSWFAFAEEIARLGLELGLLAGSPHLEPVSSEAFGDPVVRPAFSSLSTAKATAALGQPPRPWHDALRAYLTSIAARNRAESAKQEETRCTGPLKRSS